MRHGGTRTFPIRSCGRRHSYCRECNPDAADATKEVLQDLNRRFHHLGVEAARKVDRTGQGKGVPHRHFDGCQCPWHRSRLGASNPAWRGGPGYDWDGTGWKEARKLARERDEVCRRCGCPPNDRELDVHHVVLRRDGGTNELDNLLTLCHPCHMREHADKAQ